HDRVVLNDDVRGRSVGQLDPVIEHEVGQRLRGPGEVDRVVDVSREVVALDPGVVDGQFAVHAVAVAFGRVALERVPPHHGRIAAVAVEVQAAAGAVGVVVGG